MNSEWFKIRGQAVRTPDSGAYPQTAVFSKINIETAVKVITYLVGIIGFIAIFSQINILFSAAFLSLFVFSLYFEYNKKFYLPRWALNVLSLAVIVFSFYRFDMGDLVTQIIEALLILLAIKFLEDKKFRDYMQIYAIILFLLAGLGLLSLDITFSIYLFVLVILLTTSIVLLTYYSQDPNLELSRDTVIKIILKSMYIPLLAIPITVVMFVILPRTQYPLLNFLNRAEKAKIGFTDNVRLGWVSSMQEDSSTILRVNMEKIDENSLYWRGVVLDRFDGVSWKSLQKEMVFMTKPIIVKGNKINQTVYLEPYNNIYLFALDKPIFVSLRRARKYTDLTYTSFGSIERKIRYEVVSVISDTIADENIDERAYLQVPENMSPKIASLVRNLTSGKEKEESIQLIFRFLNDGSYKYSMEGLPISSTPLEDFLFNVKHGNCEYFASAFAVMLRIAGIPSRLIGGYKGGYYNAMGRYYLVPQKNAHVWVEAYVKKRGWIRIDPTPGSIEAFSSPLKGNFLFRMSLLFDTVNYYWFAFVINYNFEKQLTILHTLRTAFRKPQMKLSFNKEKTVRYAIILFLVAGAVLVVSYTAVKVVRREPEEKRLLSMFLHKMEKQGYNKKKSQGLEEFISNIPDEKMKEHSSGFVIEFEKLYYRDQAFKENDIKRLKKTIGLIKT